VKEGALEVLSAVGEFFYDPLGYVMFAFPWGKTPETSVVKLVEPWKSRYNSEYGPDVWACQFLDSLGEQILQRNFDGRTAVNPIRFATASGHGIGKSTLVAWLVKFILDTRPYSKGVITAGTQDQLKTKTWAELGKWHNMSLTKDLFRYSAGRGSMFLKSVYADNWFAAASTCKEENSEAFAGLHAATSTPFYIVDEASAVPDKIYEVMRGGLTDGEPMQFLFGNPTQNSGGFYEACQGDQAHRYITRSIDSRDVAITNKAYFLEMEKDYGSESDMFKVRCRGLFPKTGTGQFIPTHLVEEAMSREVPGNYHSDRHNPLVIGVDVARHGDDETVIWPRIGYDARSFGPRRFSGLDTIQVAGQVIAYANQFVALGRKPDAIFVDATGLGWGVYDQLKRTGHNVFAVNFGSGAVNTSKYRYRSDELWGNLRDAMERLILPQRTGGAGLATDIFKHLTQREFEFLDNGKIHLERKKDMKSRLGFSPDLADALAVTFAQDVIAMNTPVVMNSPMMAIHDYDPLESKW
jgi:hypothetical protein